MYQVCVYIATFSGNYDVELKQEYRELSQVYRSISHLEIIKS